MSIIKRYATEDYVESEIDKAIESKTSEIYVGSDEPIDPNVDIWINPDGEPTQEGVYELIETITIEEDMAVERTMEPDGTPYKFSSVAIRAKKAANIKIAQFSMYAVTTKNISLALWLPETQKTEEQWGYAEVRQYKGFWERERSDNWSVYNYTATPMYVKIPMFDTRVSEGETIRMIRSSLMQAGLTIEIWGVRA